jgi:hypothetical protein
MKFNLKFYRLNSCIEYVNNLKSIKEKYSITKNGDNQVVICDSLMYPKKNSELPTFNFITGENLELLEQKCKAIKERGIK